MLTRPVSWQVARRDGKMTRVAVTLALTVFGVGATLTPIKLGTGHIVDKYTSLYDGVVR